MATYQHLAIDLRMYRMSGIGRYLQTLLPRLIPRVNAETISVFGAREDLCDQPWAVVDPRVRIRDFNSRIFSISEQLAVTRDLYHKIDVVWTPQYNLPLLYSGKLLVTLHDLCHLAMPETLGSPIQRWYSRFLFARVAARASAILCDSDFTANEAHRLLGIQRDRLTVAYPCLDDAWIGSTVTGSRIRPAPYLLVVGNVKVNKNVLAAITSFNRIRDRIPHDLVIVGKRDGFLNADANIGEALTKADQRIAFTGHVSDADLRLYYRDADVLVFPSKYEGFGYPLVEAMALGCPIACSNASSLPEVAGDAALFFDPDSTDDIARVLLLVINDRDLRAELIRKGNTRLKHFATDKSVAIAAGVINNLLQ
ncbi:MAG: glycosyltransferase family 1 protein [Acidobacteriaceae bacterium]